MKVSMETTAVTGEKNTSNYRLLVIRRGLKMEIEHPGMKMTRGVSMVTLANSVTGRNDRTRLAAYESIDAHIVKTMGAGFAQPLLP